MEHFETLLAAHRTILERFLRFRLPCIADADDVMQEVCLTAYRKFDQLKDHSAFKPWILAIARNKCNDFFRRQASRMEIPIDDLHESKLAYGFGGYTLLDTVSETLEKLGDKDKQILYLYYFKNLPQAEIAKRLQIPLGTVKRRLHDAKQHFKTQYPYQPEERKDESNMKKLPERLPEYTITTQNAKPFAVVFEELSNWFIIPKVGESVTWGSYDLPSRKLDETVHSEVKNKIMLHGIEAVEIESMSSYADRGVHTYFAQLTDTHCRWLGESYMDANGVKHMLTFLDGDEFMEQWGFGEDNCGAETHLAPKGDIVRSGSIVTTANKQYLFDVVGRYTVEIGEKRYDTNCIMTVYPDGAAIEQYIDANGRTILWRRFNRNDWAFDRYGKRWTELLPENERLTINGETYVHWYDCITDYIL